MESNKKIKLLFLTGSRSDWGYVKPLLEECRKRKSILSKLCITNMHLLDTFGLPMKEILKEGFKIDEKIYMSLDGYNEITMAKSIGVFIQSFTDTLARIKPDWLVLSGDRAETLAAAVSAAYSNHLIAHVQAGEVSGNIDGQARHAISKFSHLHLASNIDAAVRLKKMGEEKFRIKIVGAPQLDDIIKNKKTLNNFSLTKKRYSLPENNKYIVIVYHPVTEEFDKAKKQINSFIKNVKKINLPKVWILPNNDAGSQIFKNQILENRDKLDYIFDNLPRLDYLTIIKNTKCMIGNSSSGIIESSSFCIPVIDIGRRQNKRIKAKNVIHLRENELKKIHTVFKKISKPNFLKKIKNIKNPYSKGLSSKLIIDAIIKSNKIKNILIKEITY
jgi:GDP/UDP-N,N'-diacetylbacillosamine 2-epimerase (hydrolysing)